jgi:hypothetical protein
MGPNHSHLEAAVSRRTVFLARLIGLYCLVIAFALTAHKQSSLTTLDAIVHSPDIVMITGLIALLVGLAMVIGHNIWSGGVPSVLVTIVGWITLIRSVLLLLLPADVLGFLYDAMRVDHLFYAYIGVTGVIGLYLTYVGFTAAAPTLDQR